MKQAIQLKAISFLDILSATVFKYQLCVETLLILRAVLRILNKVDPRVVQGFSEWSALVQQAE